MKVIETLKVLLNQGNRNFHYPAGRVLPILLVMMMLTIMVVVTPCARAEDDEPEYDFKLEKEYVDVYINKDGSIDIHYLFQFINYGKMDGVDVGLPNRFYDEDTAKAWVMVDDETHTPKKIHASPYVYIGLAVEFRDSTRDRIEEYGTRFTLEFQINNPHMVYRNELKDGSVGIKFRPTWFNPDFQRGDTGNLRTRIYLPMGFNDSSEAVYLSDHRWDSLAFDNSSDRYVATWNRTYVSPEDQEEGDYDVGVGFPKEYVDKYYEHDFWEKLGNFWYGVKHYTKKLGIFCLIVGGMSAMFGYGIYNDRKRARDYFEPKLTVAGAGPRKDLTAVEAALVLEKPLNTVSTMLLFGLMKKGKVEVVSYEKPVRLKKLSHTGDHSYESAYLYAIEHMGVTCKMNETGSLDTEKLKELLVDLVDDTQTKLEGFDNEATKKHYEAICERAWKQVKEARTPETFLEEFSKSNKWMLLDNDYDKRVRKEYKDAPWYDTYHYPYNHHYFYWHHYHHHSHHNVGSGGGSGKGLSVGQMMGDYAKSVRSTSENLVSDIKSLGNEVTKVTNPMASSGGGGGGCACACACAGGGR